MTDTRELVEELRHNSSCHFNGNPLARRVTGEHLSKAADTIAALSERNRALEEALRLIADIETPQAQVLLIARAALTSGGRG